jgi:hypothetical protein
VDGANRAELLEQREIIVEHLHEVAAGDEQSRAAVPRADHACGNNAAAGVYVRGRGAGGLG